MRKFNMVTSVISQMQNAIEVHHEAMDEYMALYLKGDTEMGSECRKVAEEIDILTLSMELLIEFRKQQMALEEAELAEMQVLK